MLYYIRGTPELHTTLSKRGVLAFDYNIRCQIYD